VAEQFRLEQGLGYGGTVDRDKRTIGPRAEGVKCARKQFLAGPAFPFEQYRRIGRRGTVQRD
jgi:hypothetical protein